VTTLILGEILRLAERVTAAHEEALYSLDERAPEYAVLRAETARRVLHECELREITGRVALERTATTPAPPHPGMCNHLLYRDGQCVGCGEPHPTLSTVVVPLRRTCDARA
jgi:hypothetical protein